MAKAAPDGYTIGLGPVGALAITRHMVAKLPYDIERDLLPVAIVQTGYMLLAVAPSLPVYSVKELIEYARKNPGKLSNASSSNGSPGHVSGELFKHMTGTQIVHVPYKGGAAAIGDLISGNIDLMFESTNSISAHVKTGRVRGLAVSGARRSAAFPDLPTIAEAGVPGYEVTVWSQRSARDARSEGAHRPARQRGRRRHARAVRRADPARLGQVGRGDPPLRREDRLVVYLCENIFLPATGISAVRISPFIESVM